MFRRKKTTTSSAPPRSDFFDGLPDDIVISVLCKLCSTAGCPSDFISILLTCKRLNQLGLNPLVLCEAGRGTVAVVAKNWSDGAQEFLKKCVRAGSVEASYILGLIRFYCLRCRASGASLMAKAALKSHAPALYSLALMQFNGSGGLKDTKNLRAGVVLCARAASLGHVDALRELGHCLIDGYGVTQDTDEGRRLLVQANARELASVLSYLNKPPSFHHLMTWQSQNQPQEATIGTDPRDGDSDSDFGGELWSDYGCVLPEREVLPANKFLAEWFGSRGEHPGFGLKMCSYSGCGRPETRSNEFRKCSCCGKVNYCSRGCQAQDWKMRHKAECAPMNRGWIDDHMVEGEGEHGPN